MLAAYFYITFNAVSPAVQQSDSGQTILITFMVLFGLAVFLFLTTLILRSGLKGLSTFFRGMLSRLYARAKGSAEPIAGFAYDKYQDIFYSVIDAWQRDFGYCRLYDEAATPLSIIIDCEPIYFDYAGKYWLIEFWKGQYGIASGCEVGVYNTARQELRIPGIFYGTYYDAAGPADMLRISYVLYKNKNILFKQSGRHWWLAGLKLGIFSEASELTAMISLALKDKNMLAAFLAGMINAGYTGSDYTVRGNTVRFIFGNPKTAQPYTRTPEIEHSMQAKNKYLCDRFNELTRNKKGGAAKLEALRSLDPFVYNEIADLGGAKKIFSKHETLEEYLQETR